jgi:hypothetical protein
MRAIILAASLAAMMVSAVALMTVVALTPIQASAQDQCPPNWYDRYGCMLNYNPARGDPGPGNGPIWQGEPTDRNSIWRRGYYRGNDPDNRIRQQLMRDK